MPELLNENIALLAVLHLIYDSGAMGIAARMKNFHFFERGVDKRENLWCNDLEG